MVSFLGTRKARARGSEGPSSAAPQTSTAPVPATSGPSAQSTDLMMAMLQSIHQGQYLVM